MFKSLKEGFTQSIVNRIKSYFATKRVDDSVMKSKSRNMGLMDNLYFNIYPNLSDAMKLDFDILSRYSDYDDMDDYPVISTAFDIYADDSNQLDILKNSTIWVDSESNEIKKLLNDVLYNRLNVEDIIWDLTRNLCKYGNDFEELILSSRGVERMVYIPTHTMRRVEINRNLYGFIQDKDGSNYYNYAHTMDFRNLQSFKSDSLSNNLVLFEPFEVIHFRLLSKRRDSLYGFSISEPARWVFKRLMLLQDAMLIHKLTRAVSRFIFYVDAGEVNFVDAMKYADLVRQKYKRKKYINPDTGKVDMRYNPLADDEDFFIPIVGGRETTRIEQLSGLDYQNTDVVEYFDNLIYSAFKIPKAYLSFDGEVRGKAVLSMEDIRYARSIMRIQRVIKNEFSNILSLHLLILGINPDSVDYDVVMTTPSSILELAQLEAMNVKLDFADKFGGYVSTYWILSKLFGFNDSQIEKIYSQKIEDSYKEMRLEYDANRKFEEYKNKIEGADVGLGNNQGDEIGQEIPKAGNKDIGIEPPEGEGIQLLGDNKQVSNYHGWLYENRNKQKNIRRNNGQSNQSIDEVMHTIMKGNKDLEKLIEDKFDKIIQDNKELNNKLKRAHNFMVDLRNNLR